MSPSRLEGKVPFPRTPMRGKLRIALVTSDVLGPVRNGGVGTATWEIARLLAHEGHAVAVFFAPTTDTNVEGFETWQNLYLEQGIALIPARVPALRLECQLPLQRSYAIYEQLRRYEVDLVHFPDMHGLGYYSLVSKRLGLDFGSTALVVQAHGPNSWHRQFNEQDLSTLDEVFMDFMERKSFELADRLVAPHSSILDWAKNRSWVPEGEVSILPWPCESIELPALPSKATPREVVFFGRLETRKGLETFCDAMDLLAQAPDSPRRVTFLGKPGSIRQGDVLERIRARSARWPFPVSLFTDLDREAALRYLKDGPKLAILASRAETFGFTLEECLRRQIPFIASPLPVFLERVDPDSHSSSFFDGTAAGLARGIQNALANGITPARPSKGSALEPWIEWHSKLPPAKQSSRKKATNPLISVCITHRNRSELLSEAVRSIESQTYAKIELIVADDASDSPAAISYLDRLEKEFAAKDWKVLRQSERTGPGKLRNRAVAEAKGEYVLLMDDDNVAKPEEIETFVDAALSSNADILTCFFDRTLDEAGGSGLSSVSRWLCLGGDLSSGFFHNVFGDMNCFVRRKSFLDAGGVHEELGVGCEDWEFFARAVAKGLRLLPVPRALFHYRDHPGSYTQQVDAFRSRLLPRTVYSLALPTGSVTALASYFASQIRFDPLQPAPRLSVESSPIFGTVNGADIFRGEEKFKRVLLDLSDPASAGKLQPLRQLELHSEASGALRIDSTGNDPGLELSEFDLAGSSDVILELDIESPTETVFQFFYRSSGVSEYEERLSVRKALHPGMNHLRLLVSEPNLRGPFRFDPSEKEGSYRFHALRLRAEP